MAWTKVTKPITSNYNRTGPVGKQTYDEADITYDSAVTYYDSVNPNQWTDISKPATNAWMNVSKPT